MTVRAAQGDNPAIVAPLGLEFQITSKFLYKFQLLLYQKKMTQNF